MKQSAFVVCRYKNPGSTPNKTSPTAPIGASNATTEREPTRQERDQLFDDAANGMVPEHVKKKPEDPLKKWWPQIKRKLKEGYSVRQIRAMIQSPKIGLKVSARSLKQFMAEHSKAQTAAPTGK